MKSRNGVYYDLNESTYRFTLDGLTFVFSSRLNRKKFEERYQKNRNAINESLSKRFNLLVDVDALADVVLYSKIESRGFLIVSKEGNISCRSNAKFDGLKVTGQN